MSPAAPISYSTSPSRGTDKGLVIKNFVDRQTQSNHTGRQQSPAPPIRLPVTGEDSGTYVHTYVE